MSDPLTLTAILLGTLLVGSLALFARDVWSKRLDARLGEVRLFDSAADDQPVSIRVAPVKEGRFAVRLGALVGFTPGASNQSRVPWQLIVGLACVAGVISAYNAMRLGGTAAAVLAFPATTFFTARGVFGWQKRRYRTQLLEQIPDAMDFISRGIRSGIPLGEALRSVSRELSSPSRESFQQINGDLAIGRSIEQALWRMAEQTGLQEYSFFAVAVGLQAQTGGSLFETLDNLSDIVRQRLAVAKRGKALAAEAKASAVVLILLPFLAAGMMSMARPGYLDVFFDSPRGTRLLLVAFTLLGAGMLSMREMMRRSLAL